MTRQIKKKKHTALKIFIAILFIAFFTIAGILGYDYYIRETHPIKYENYVERYARENNIDKVMVYAVIKTESGFDSGAVSNVGARGLMQIMEETFDWIKYRLDDEDTEYIDMFEPKTNIKYGSYLLGYLNSEFEDDDAVFAAYHAGVGNVSEWLDDPRYSSDGVHLDEIPISATKHYVSKINKTIETYKKLYDL